jgi:hypothetical protein
MQETFKAIFVSEESNYRKNVIESQSSIFQGLSNDVFTFSIGPGTTELWSSAIRKLVLLRRGGKYERNCFMTSILQIALDSGQSIICSAFSFSSTFLQSLFRRVGVPSGELGSSVTNRYG